MSSLISSLPSRVQGGQLLIVDRDLAADGYSSGLGATYRISVATGVGVARRFMQQFPPELVVTDMKLDDGTGLDICREAKSLTMPAAVLVTTTSPELAPDAILAGCDGVLLKPFAPNLLYARIGRILRMRDRSRHHRARGNASIERIQPERSRLRHQEERRELLPARAILEWPDTHCPHCGHRGVSSFDYVSMRRAWYACLDCRKVWIAKRQE